MDVTIRKGYTRWQASGIHLLISAAIAASVLTVMLSVWYARPLFEADGGMGLLFILVGVDVDHAHHFLVLSNLETAP